MLTLNIINNCLKTQLTLSVKKQRNIYNEINNIFTDNDIFDKNTIIMSLIYLYRYNKEFLITSKKLSNLIKSSIILANKFHLDREIHGKGKYELEILNKLNWNLYISAAEFNSFNEQIVV